MIRYVTLTGACLVFDDEVGMLLGGACSIGDAREALSSTNESICFDNSGRACSTVAASDSTCLGHVR